MKIIENPSYEVMAIPIKNIRERHEYLSIKLFNDKQSLHELHCFLREVCSKNAYPIQDIFKIVLNSKESFSPNLYKMIKSLTANQFSRAVKSNIIEKVCDDYDSYISYHKNWKCLSLKNSSILNRDKFFIRLFKKMNIIKETFYYYDDKFINLYTIPDSDLPLYLSYEWPTDQDRELFNERIKNINEKNEGYKKPNVI